MNGVKRPTRQTARVKPHGNVLQFEDQERSMNLLFHMLIENSSRLGVYETSIKGASNYKQGREKQEQRYLSYKKA